LVSALYLSLLSTADALASIAPPVCRPACACDIADAARLLEIADAFGFRSTVEAIDETRDEVVFLFILLPFLCARDMTAQAVCMYSLSTYETGRELRIPLKRSFYAMIFFPQGDTALRNPFCD
jgi:hypothetical protein